MKLFLVFSCFVAAALCLPARLLPALSHEEIHDEFGQYHLRYVTAEGTIVSERGILKPTLDGKSLVLVKEGESTWVAPDGKTYSVKYTAGSEGYLPVGEHLPKSPFV